MTTDNAAHDYWTHDCADCERYRQAEAEAEAHAEGAWLRAAEAGTPDTWAEEDRERMTDALGYGPPPF